MKLRLFVVALGVLVSGHAFAQDSTSNSSTASNATANTQSGANSSNEGVTAIVNQNTSGHLKYSGSYEVTGKSQVPISSVGYGSFSQSSCITSIGGGATTRFFSFVYNGPKADINCQHVVLGDAFGRATQLAMQVKQPEMALKALSMVFFKYCTSDEDTKQACIQLGLVLDTGKVRRSHGNDVAIVLPVKTLPEGADKMASALGVPTESMAKVRSPTGWTVIRGGSNTSVKVPSSPPQGQQTLAKWAQAGDL